MKEGTREEGETSGRREGEGEGEGEGEWESEGEGVGVGMEMKMGTAEGGYRVDLISPLPLLIFLHL